MLCDLHADHVERTAIDAVLVGVGDDRILTGVELLNVGHDEPATRVIVVFVDDVTGVNVAHADLGDLDDRADHRLVIGKEQPALKPFFWLLGGLLKGSGHC